VINAKFQSGIYAITDNVLNLEQKVEQCLKAGISLLQYRNKIANLQQKEKQAKQLLKLCQQYKVPFIINDDVVLAKKIGANGVHLGKTDATYQMARQQLGKQAIIGISCYNQLELALEAQQQGADYIAFGRFFPSNTKPNACLAPLEILQQASQKITIPIVAIGGITPQNGQLLVQHGAQLLAVVGGLFANQNQINQVKLYQTCFEENQ